MSKFWEVVEYSEELQEKLYKLICNMPTDEKVILELLDIVANNGSWEQFEWILFIEKLLADGVIYKNKNEVYYE